MRCDATDSGSSQPERARCRLFACRGRSFLSHIWAHRLAQPAELTSFWYDDTDLGGDARAVAQADARKFAPDGSLRDASHRIYHRGTPHLFLRARVLVIYAGDDQGMLEVLNRLLGPQFAGG